MEFRTELSVSPAPWNIGWKDAILTLGSCFADSIGVRLQRNKWNTLVNPFGTLYHPLGLHKVMNYASRKEYPKPGTYTQREDIHVNYDFHSSFSSIALSGLQERINHQIATTHFFLKDCKVLLITYGTAWVFERKDTGETVANCHKLPADQFTRRLSTIEALKASFRDTYLTLQQNYPDLHIIVTVSPVRHLKDTLVMNSVSKSLLRVFCEEISHEHGVQYFPAYEIMMDDLRDYRYYAADMIHPSAIAENYIWEKFGQTFFNASTLQNLATWEEIYKALQHRPFHTDSKSYGKFVLNLQARLEKIQALTDVTYELNLVKSLLTGKSE